MVMTRGGRASSHPANKPRAAHRTNALVTRSPQPERAWPRLLSRCHGEIKRSQQMLQLLFIITSCQGWKFSNELRWLCIQNNRDVLTKKYIKYLFSSWLYYEQTSNGLKCLKTLSVSQNIRPCHHLIPLPWILISSNWRSFLSPSSLRYTLCLYQKHDGSSEMSGWR